MILYAETTAVLAWLFGEREAEGLKRVIDAAEDVVTSELTLLEVRRAVVRGQARRLFTVSVARQLTSVFELSSAGWDVMQMTAAIRNRASRSFPVEPVRTLDAIHLATAIELGRVYELSVLSLDRRVIDNLQPLGLQSARST